MSIADLPRAGMYCLDGVIAKANLMRTHNLSCLAIGCWTFQCWISIRITSMRCDAAYGRRRTMSENIQNRLVSAVEPIMDSVLSGTLGC